MIFLYAKNTSELKPVKGHSDRYRRDIESDAFWIKIKSVRGEKFHSTLDEGNDFDETAADIQNYNPYIRGYTWECGQ